MSSEDAAAAAAPIPSSDAAGSGDMLQSPQTPEFNDLIYSTSADDASLVFLENIDAKLEAGDFEDVGGTCSL